MADRYARRRDGEDVWLQVFRVRAEALQASVGYFCRWSDGERGLK
jgi:hypothetical protein